MESDGPDIYLTLGDLTRIRAAAIVLPVDRHGVHSPIQGKLTAAVRAFRGFDAAYETAFSAYRAAPGRSAADGIAEGDGFFVPLPESASGLRGVAVVNTVAADPLRSDAVVADAAKRAVALSVEALRGTVARPLVAIPGLATGQGGGKDRLLRVARAQVGAVAESAKRAGAPVDIAFVLYDPVTYNAFVGARKELDLAPPVVADPEHIAQISQAVVAGTCALFVGSGLSVGAKLPDYEALIDRLLEDLEPRAVDDARKIDLKSAEACLEAAQWYRHKFPQDHARRIRGILTELFDLEEARPSLAHYLLLSLPIRKILTTNYDQLLERALEALHRFPLQVVHKGDVPRTAERDLTCVVKLHGDVKVSDRDDVDGGGIVLSADDYAAFFERRPVMAAMLESLLLNHTFLFVGYSLRDPNFRSIFHRIDTILKEVHHPAFATVFGKPTEMVRELWEAKGLRLMAMEGEDAPAQSRHLLRVLDALCVATLSQNRPLLHRDYHGEQTPAFRAVGKALGSLGERLLSLDPAELNLDEARLCADALALVTAGGAKRSESVRAWERLLVRLAQEKAANPYLPAALDCAGSEEEARRIRRAAGDPERG